MLIIALVASLSIAMMPGTGRARLKAVTLETAALLRRERLARFSPGANATYRLTASAASSWATAAISSRFPVTWSSTFSASTSCGRTASLVVRFHPDGASSGGGAQVFT